jgi:ribosomal protein S18 acetylase RimI-like enzyme
VELVMASLESSASSTEGIEPLTVDDVPRLIPAGNPRIDAADLRAILSTSPHQSFWMPESGEFVIVAPWRNRPELPCVHTLWSFRHDGPLIQAAVGAAAERDAAALVMLETGERRRPAFYHQHGFSRIEIIRTYEHIEPRVLARQYDPGSQKFVRVTPDQPVLLAGVQMLDHAAFPWFWWNSLEEFGVYLRMPDVEVWAGIRAGEVVSYIGFTSFHQWAHLDRIAVAPGVQGHGIGRSAVAYAAKRMVAEGARHIGLSTQSGNRVSRHLYESLGFRHTRQADYDVFGIVLDAGRVFAPAGSAPRAYES